MTITIKELDNVYALRGNSYILDIEAENVDDLVTALEEALQHMSSFFQYHITYQSADTDRGVEEYCYPEFVSFTSYVTLVAQLDDIRGLSDLLIDQPLSNIRAELVDIFPECDEIEVYIRPTIDSITVARQDDGKYRVTIGVAFEEETI